MKKIFFLAVASLMIASCHKPVSNDCNKPQNEGTPQWIWLYSQGGIGGADMYPSTQSAIGLSLNPDSTYAFYLNNHIEQKGNYHFALDSTRHSILYFDKMINIENFHLQEEQSVFKMDDNNLELFDNNITDGFMSYFGKVLK